MPGTPPTHAKGTSRFHLMLAFAYLLLIVYGSLFPFGPWIPPSGSMWHYLVAPWPHDISGADVATNLLAYVPVGLLLIWCLPRARWLASFVFGMAVGSGLSSLMEAIQSYLPERTSSKVDLLNNVIGSAAGAILGLLFRPEARTRFWLDEQRRAWFKLDRAADVTLAATAMWLLSQWTPLVPETDVGAVRHALSPIRAVFEHPKTFGVLHFATYLFAAAGLMLALQLASRPEKRLMRYLPFLFGAAILAKMFVTTRFVSLEALLGIMAATLLLAALGGRAGPGTAALLVLAAFVATETRSADGTLQGFNWMPFYGEYVNTLNGFQEVLDGLWPFVALAAIAFERNSPKPRTLAVGTAFVALLSFVCEWAQRFIPGRYPDITSAILAVLGWGFGCWWIARGEREESRPKTSDITDLPSRN